jgi:hypothetical protein
MNPRKTMAIAILAAGGALLASRTTTSQANQAKLFITPAGNGNYLVVVDGHGPANAQVGIRVRGEDTWFDDRLFSYGVPSHSGPDGAFNVATTVAGSSLNEDWGQDEVYAIADVGNRSMRTNTIKGSF